jgi:SAM-dependent methyltransferase
MLDDSRRAWLQAAAAASVCWAVPGRAAEPAGRRFEDAGRWSKQFDGPARDAWQKPDEVIAALAPARDAVVADIGSGTGYFATRLARAVPSGRVYGADMEPDMVAHLARRAKDEGLANLVAVQAVRDGPALPEPVDLMLLVNVQGLMVRPGDYFQRLQTSLKPGARLAIIAWKPESPGGAPVEMRVPAEQTRRDIARQGYTLVAEHDFLPYQYFLVFQAKQAASSHPAAGRVGTGRP